MAVVLMVLLVWWIYVPSHHFFEDKLRTWCPVCLLTKIFLAVSRNRRNKWKALKT